MTVQTTPHNSGERSPGFRLGADRAGACMRQGAAEQIASEIARAAARAASKLKSESVKLQTLTCAIGGESGIRTHGTVSRTHAFQACALSHSAISPGGPLLKRHEAFCKRLPRAAVEIRLIC